MFRLGTKTTHKPKPTKSKDTGKGWDGIIIMGVALYVIGSIALAWYLQRSMDSIVDGEEDDHVYEMDMKIEEFVRELEAKSTFEETVRERLEIQIKRQKETIQFMKEEYDGYANMTSDCQEHMRNSKSQVRHLKEDNTILQQKQIESEAKQGDLERKIKCADSQLLALQKDLKEKDERIEDFQLTISRKIDVDTDLIPDSDENVISDDEESLRILIH